MKYKTYRAIIQISPSYVHKGHQKFQHLLWLSGIDLKKRQPFTKEHGPEVMSINDPSACQALENAFRSVDTKMNVRRGLWQL